MGTRDRPSRKQRSFVILVGCSAIALLSVAASLTTVERKCGHRQLVIRRLSGKIPGAASAHDEVDAALERWKTDRTPEDFRCILGHLPRPLTRRRLEDLLLGGHTAPGETARFLFSEHIGLVTFDAQGILTDHELLTLHEFRSRERARPGYPRLLPCK